MIVCFQGPHCSYRSGLQMTYGNSRNCDWAACTSCVFFYETAGKDNGKWATFKWRFSRLSATQSASQHRSASSHLRIIHAHSHTNRAAIRISLEINILLKDMLITRQSAFPKFTQQMILFMTIAKYPSKSRADFG